MKYTIQIINFNDKNYPQSLKNIYNPPKKLYAVGDISILNKNIIAVVGCRMCSGYGIEMAEKMSYELAKKNIIVASGLARGIDTWAHIGCMKAGGKTIAVIGSGLDIIYPPENRGIYEKIIQTGGAIISEYKLGTKPIASNFPNRNRIIAGLAKGVLVVEAKKRSGSLITVDFALEQGKEVFAIPGDIDKPNSVGTNELIKYGAKVVTSVEDILDEIKVE